MCVGCTRFRLLTAVLLVAGLCGGQAAARDLTVGAADVRLEPRDDGGYDLYVRKKPDIACVLLTETTKDPTGKADNYAYRAAEHNPVNGDEKRLLNGKPIPAESHLYSLISSTPVADARFGSAFRILTFWSIWMLPMLYRPGAEN